ncbi:hypothetical protein KIN20_004075 [Parelaphostrongylus tenuis]|uniref:Uncharacterized protein n=1 Tax=Parelaphostrongylus tenuis TaxID=148309 RepID=A0AAD5MGI2_PARTN|nr:hypothetical protein KIN20_004075 [Parelaphostrongylus tenuis]
MEVGPPPEEEKQPDNTEESGRRGSYPRINETFEYVKDDDGTTQLNVTHTPPSDARRIINASHRKSSRHSKEKQFREKDGESVMFANFDDIHNTPILSKKSHHSVKYCPGKENLQEGHCYRCEGEPGNQLKSCSGEKRERAAAGTSPLSSIGNGLAQVFSPSNVNTVQTRKSLTPRGGFSAPTFSSAAKSVKRKETLFLNFNDPLSKGDNVTTSGWNKKLTSKIPSPTKSRRGVLERLPLTSRPIRKATENASKFFARRHAAIFAKMETIGDRQARISRRHEEIMRAVPKVANRLATPKATRIPHRQRDADKSTNKFELFCDNSNITTSFTGTSFSFERPTDNAQGQGVLDPGETSLDHKNPEVGTEENLRSRMRSTSKQKEAGDSVSKILPTNSASIDISSVSKGKAPTRSASGKTIYSPHRGAIGAFLDTTKLTDRQFELAVANGLIKAKRVRSSIQKEASRKIRKDEILHVKKKLNIVH